MKLPRSWFGAGLAVVYVVAATYITQDEIRHSHGGWINLRGLGTTLITAPSQVLVAPVLRLFGVPAVNYANLGFAAYCQFVIHILVSAMVVYLLGVALHRISRRTIRFVRQPPSDGWVS